jgi:elongation factor P--(R)-beta-lysine ligase
VRTRFRDGLANGTMLARARDMHRNATDAEQKLWSRLRRKSLGVGFKRQYPVGGFIADFCCVEQRLVIELDGEQHAEGLAYDARRTELLSRKGFRVLRFWNGDVTENIDGVLEHILDALGNPAPSPQPSPATEKRERGSLA